ncbi:AAA family ATPase [Clavibacter capsici]|uniref:AAA family ATPase n=1 Tax=Clavibacter capsici TaxID=1874630 RepID=UPI0006B224F3|nr:AAA family ATPase [Clavibacter capsici]ALD13132.1 hypothetical protein AES38_09550 [Clavibacter capsici]
MTTPDPLTSAFSAQWLMDQTFPPLEYVIPGIIPQGLSLLVASPKIGKSWFVLGVAVACASGGTALGTLTVDRRPVLYLALEDGKKRLQSRLRSLGVTEPPEGLDFIIETQNVLASAHAFMERHREANPLVILDTLGKVMPSANSGETSYERDYRIAGLLKAAADSVPGGSVVVVHHTRKADSTDFLDSVSGTQGLAGAADSILAITRERNTPTATLRVTSRDAAEGEYQMRLDDAGRWTLDGDDLTTAARSAQTTRATANLNDRSAEIVTKLQDHPEGIKARDLALLVNIGPEQIATYLSRLARANRIQQLARGLYGPLPIPPVTCVESVTSPD